MSETIWVIVKFALTAAIIVAVSEVTKRVQDTWYGALLVSLPIISYLSFIWIYVETRDAQKLGALSFDIFWLVLPSLTLFLALPLLLKRMPFPPALLLSTLVMFGAYALTTYLLGLAKSNGGS